MGYKFDNDTDWSVQLFRLLATVGAEPLREGSDMRKIAANFFMLALLGGCNPRPQAKATAPPPEVLVTDAISDTITDFEEFTGYTDAKNMVEVRARVTGYLDK